MTKNQSEIEQLSTIENGRMNPTLSTLEKIAEALGISSSKLLK